MNSASYLEEPQVAYLSRIIQDVKSGSILIPRFQRRFVWSVDDRLKLLESIRDGIPIGSFLVWRTSSHKLDTFPTIGGVPVPIGPDAYTNVPRQYLLDGHQRLSTLFGALSGGPAKFSRDAEEPDFKAGDIVYDLRQEEFVVVSKKTMQGGYYLALNKLLESIELLKFQRSLIGLPDEYELVERADVLANRFRNYKIPIIPIATDDLDAATRAFERINSTGVRMDDYHMVAALTYSPYFSLSDQVEEAKSRLDKYSWGEIDEKYILAIIRVKQDLEISSPNASETSKFIKENPFAISEAVESLISAAKFLRDECLIPSPQFLPYSYQIVFLSFAFSIGCGTDRVHLLKRWLWQTTYSGFFRGARESDLSEARRHIELIVELGIDNLGDDRRFDYLVRPDKGRFDFRSARSRAIVNCLARFQLKVFPDRKDELLESMADMGPKCLHTFLTPRDYSGPEVSGFENRFLMPFTSTLKLHGDGELPFLSGDDEEMSAHGVDWLTLDHLYKGDPEEFFRSRRRHILEEESYFVHSVGLRYQISSATE